MEEAPDVVPRAVIHLQADRGALAGFLREAVDVLRLEVS